jgi:hypothetical protein
MRFGLASPDAISLSPDLTKPISNRPGDNVRGGVFVGDTHRIVAHRDQRSKTQDVQLLRSARRCR